VALVIRDSRIARQSGEHISQCGEGKVDALCLHQSLSFSTGHRHALRAREIHEVNLAQSELCGRDFAGLSSLGRPVALLSQPTLHMQSEDGVAPVPSIKPRSRYITNIMSSSVSFDGSPGGYVVALCGPSGSVLQTSVDELEGLLRSGHRDTQVVARQKHSCALTLTHFDLIGATGRNGGVYGGGGGRPIAGEWPGRVVFALTSSVKLLGSKVQQIPETATLS
jgi:hypothetical protein